MSQAVPLITRRAIALPLSAGLRTPFARQGDGISWHFPPLILGKMVVGEMLARSDIPA